MTAAKVPPSFIAIRLVWVLVFLSLGAGFGVWAFQQCQAAISTIIADINGSPWYAEWWPADDGALRDWAGTWQGQVRSDVTGSVYSLSLALEPSGADYVGTVWESSDSGTVGSWTVSGTPQGDVLALRAGQWIQQPNESWFMDDITLYSIGNDASDVLLTAQGEVEPWGSGVVQR